MAAVPAAAPRTQSASTVVLKACLRRLVLSVAPARSGLNADITIDETLLNSPTGEPEWSGSSLFAAHDRVKQVILIRHAQSTANAENSVYGYVPDWRIPLTKLGREQARRLGQKLASTIGNSPVYFYVSPYVRTKQTYTALREGLGSGVRVLGAREDPRLAEQQFGNYQNPRTMDVLFGIRQLYGRFFWRFREGESGADVYNRVGGLLESLSDDVRTFPEGEEVTLILITHGLTLRCFLLRWFQMGIRLFEKMTNPPNCGMVRLIRGDDGRYSIDSASKAVVSFPDLTRGTAQESEGTKSLPK